MKYIPTIGLEVHVQLNTNSKLFSTAATSFGDDPNTHTTAVCLGLPGALPVLNREAVKKAVLAGLAIDGTIHKRSRFDRKNYFYPDLPKGYQISQLYEPYCTSGHLNVTRENGETITIGITRIHMEEDAGKLIHSENSAIRESYVDLNRAGTPLIEIVSDPVIDTPDDAVAYMNTLKNILEYIGVSDCNMEQGSLRVDANVSIRPEGTEKLGTRVEIKNLNSFKAMKAAIEYEMERQEDLIERGGKVVQETRLWNAATGVTLSMRSKEEAHDYRYFPDPDLVPLVLTDAEIEAIRAELPELPEQRKKRFLSQYELPEYDAALLTSQRSYADYFESAAIGVPPKKAANWILSEMLKETGERNCTLEQLFPATYLSELISEIESGRISGKIGKQVFSKMLENPKPPKQIIQEEGLVQISDTSELEKIIEEVIAADPTSVEDYRAGKERAFKALMGQAMKLSRGKANPQLITELLTARLKQDN